MFFLSGRQTIDDWRGRVYDWGMKVERWLLVESGLFFGVVVVGLLVLSRPELGRGFWFDEAVTARGSQLPVAQIFSWAARYDSDLPLPYLVYRLGGLMAGWSESALRMVSLLLVAGTLALLFGQWRPTAGRWAWLVGLAACLPAFQWPAGEVRYYALLFLATLFSHTQTVQFVEQPNRSRWWVVLGWLAPVLVYPLGGVVSLWHGLFVMIHLVRHRRWADLIVCGGGAGLLLGLLVGPFLLDDFGRQTFWPGVLDYGAVRQEMAGFLLSGSYFPAGAWPFLVVIFVSLLAAYWCRKTTVQLALLTLWGGWVSLLWLMLSRPVFQVRYALPLLASWLVLWAALAVMSRPGRIVALLLVGLMFYSGQTAIGYPEHDVQLREAAQWVEQAADPNDLIVAWPPDMANALAYYLPGRITSWGPPGIWAIQNMAVFEQSWQLMMADPSRPVWILNVTAYASHDPTQLLSTLLEWNGATVRNAKTFQHIEILQAELAETARPGITFPLARQMVNGPRLEQVSLFTERWCVDQPQPVYLWWTRPVGQVPEYDFRLSVRLTPGRDDLTPIAQQDGSPIPDWANVTYFADWWPAETIEIGRFQLQGAVPGRYALLLITYQEQEMQITPLETLPITEIVVEACAN